MLQSEQLSLIRDFHRSLTLEALRLGDESDQNRHYYVQYFEKLNLQEDPIKVLATQISFSEGASVHLLSGQRGNGKTTELFRLKNLLHDQHKTCVLYCDIKNHLNVLVETDPSAFLVAVMAGLSTAYEALTSDSLGKESYLSRLHRFLNTEVVLESTKLKAGLADIQLSLRTDGGFSKELEQALSHSGQYGAFARDAHTFASEIAAKLRSRPEFGADTQVVLIVDSMEQAGGGRQDPDAADVYASVRRLFTDEFQQLRLPGMQVLYTVPPWLAAMAPGQVNETRKFPNPHVLDRVTGGLHDTGYQILLAVVEERFQRWRELISEAQFKRLVWASGGDFRDLFRLLRDVLTRAAAAESPRVKNVMVQGAERALIDTVLLTKQDKYLLRAIHASKQVEIADDSEIALLVRLFGGTLVQEYRNGETWYDIHPLIRRQLGINNDEQPQLSTADD